MDSHWEGSFHPAPIEEFGDLCETKFGAPAIGHKACESLRCDQIYTSQCFFYLFTKKINKIKNKERKKERKKEEK